MNWEICCNPANRIGVKLMKTRKLLFAAALAALPCLSPAADFPLEFKTLTAPEALALPGGGSTAAVVDLQKPADIRKEPPAISRHPLYGQVMFQSSRLCFRLDESQGDGRGYDRMIMDLKQDGDLTGEPVIPCLEPGHLPSATQSVVTNVFGPITAPDRYKIAGFQPVYFAQVYLLHVSMISVVNGVNQVQSNVLAVEARLRAGWCLQTTVDSDGVTRKVHLVDGNCDFRLGGPNPPSISSDTGGKSSWSFPNGDLFLQEIAGSGNLASASANLESAPFGQLVYLGSKPYRTSLAADYKSLSLEPWPAPTAELSLQPHGAEISRLSLAWEYQPGQWQFLEPGFDNGKVTVPAGNYRLYSCQLKVKTADGGTLTLAGSKRAMEDPVKAVAGASTPLRFGTPLQVNVSSARQTTTVASGLQSLVGRLFGRSSPSNEPWNQVIQASILGLGGEQYQYSSFTPRDAAAKYRNAQARLYHHDCRRQTGRIRHHGVWVKRHLFALMASAPEFGGSDGQIQRGLEPGAG